MKGSYKSCNNCSKDHKKCLKEKDDQPCNNCKRKNIECIIPKRIKYLKRNNIPRKGKEILLKRKRERIYDNCKYCVQVKFLDEEKTCRNCRKEQQLAAEADLYLIYDL